MPRRSFHPRTPQYGNLWKTVAMGHSGEVLLWRQNWRQNEPVLGSDFLDKTGILIHIIFHIILFYSIYKIILDTSSTVSSYGNRQNCPRIDPVTTIPKTLKEVFERNSQELDSNFKMSSKMIILQELWFNWALNRINSAWTNQTTAKNMCIYKKKPIH